LPKTFRVVRGYRYKAGVVLFFERQDELVVFVAERLDGGQVGSRVSTFPDVFSRNAPIMLWPIIGIE